MLFKSLAIILSFDPFNFVRHVKIFLSGNLTEIQRICASNKWDDWSITGKI